MTNNPGASFGSGPEKKVGSISIPESLAEQKKALSIELNGLADLRANAEKNSATKPTTDFEDFKKKNRALELARGVREATANILYKQPDVAAEMAASTQTFNQAVSDKKLSWKQAANDPALISIVKYSTGLEKTATTPSTIVIPEGYKSRGQPTTSLDARTEGDLRLKRDGSIEDRFILRPVGTVKKPDGLLDFTETKKEDFKTIANEYNQAIESSQKGVNASPTSLSETDALIARLEARNSERAAKNGVTQAPKKSEVTVNNFSADEQAAKKAEWLKNNPRGDEPDEVLVRKDAPLDIDLAQMEKSTTAKAPTPLDINLDALEAEARRSKAPEVLPRTIRPVEERKALEEVFKKGVEAAPVRMEQVSRRLEQRQQESQSRLEKLGLKLKAGADAWKNAKPRYKIALGVTLAGASVATGGLTAVIGANAMKLLSASSYASGFYDKILKAEQAKNPNVKKGWIVARSIGYGVIAAYATSTLIGQITEHMDIGDTLDAAKEKVASMKDAIKSWFSSSPQVDFGAQPINGLDLPPEMPINGLDLPGAQPVNGLDLPSQSHAPVSVVPQEPMGPPVGGPITPDVVAPSSSLVITMDNLDGNVTGVGVPDNMPTPSDLDGNVTGEGVPNNIQTIDNLDGNVTGTGVPNNIQQQDILRDSSGNPVRSGSGGTISTGGIADNRP